jgi:hypothetical protein
VGTELEQAKKAREAAQELEDPEPEETDEAEGGRQGPKGKKGKGDRDGAETARKEFVFARIHFGDPEGEWDYVTEKMNGNKWFVFVVAGLSRGEIMDAAEIHEYWLYEGREAPELTLNRKEWIFKDRSPQRYDDFSLLPKAIRDYLKDLEAVPDPVAPPAPASGGPHGDLPSKKTGPKGEIVESIEGEVEANQPEPFIHGKSQPRAKKKGPNGEEIEEIDEGPHEGETGFSGAIRRKLKRLEKDLPEGVIAAVQAVELSLSGSGIGALIESSKTREGQTKRRQKAESDLKGSPDLPGLSPMALGFLVSELLCRVDMDCGWAAGRYCHYLSTALGDLRVEFWCLRGSDWIKVAHEGEGEREAQESMPRLESRVGQGESPVWTVDDGQKVVAVRDASGNVLGGLAVTGVNAARVPDAFMDANADILRGLALALSEGQQAA